ncbi:hypothetical protein AN6076.2 [Aspergillus nidulans FGSC A4]|uniref:SNF2 family helicase, putative (AFU_orthologue AFUA_2G09120) n=1 Tax=Emericella nidulans (strain FGSC A4 / ATCC 38163 / CBS 112.46 / NRRL 194 / M139) TaxID=227321 RepID=Q5B054_EMENI|nr:hypothetical protein [Aspergillus nidulans FGSC A4]EAA58051.1 hypothetical protein AN6076.2 [Aspergillus nidulans FGSC A4]CBF70236.1 TPA: SNF2 family helicase, putative (AFU_orthologue; AFUA_2G09120) [Aspergillus nidulans FGSC A4]|eukprot:XP_663680.1 hypothetical protein AN6076.2 [Aspergillus nidulans FGSC A4]
MPAKRKPPVIATLASSRSRRYPHQSGTVPEPAHQSEFRLEPGPDLQIRLKVEVEAEFGLHGTRHHQPKPFTQDGSTISARQFRPGELEPLSKYEDVSNEDDNDGSNVAKRPRMVVVLRLPLSLNKPGPRFQSVQRAHDTSVTATDPYPDSGAYRAALKREHPNSIVATSAVKRPRRSPRFQQSNAGQLEAADEVLDGAKAHQGVAGVKNKIPSATNNTLPSPSKMVAAMARSSIIQFSFSSTGCRIPSLDDNNTDQGPSRLDPNTPELIRSQPYSGRMRPRTQLAQHLPPLYKLSDIFKSLTERAIDLGLDKVLTHLGNRRLRVATVCSGTESPLLALEMVKENLQKYFNRDLDFKHLFSAEIVPYKQAYIERNFRPRLLFRDVAELKDRVARTAYGSLEKVPKNADMLIAGFSCVDFSGLNNYRKELDETGESGDTFWGIICYAKIYRPRMVILENVKTAPWAKIEGHWNDIDYVAVHSDVDTKAYYLPQTRERGYMFCVDKRLLSHLAQNHHGLGLDADEIGLNMRREWVDTLAAFKRPASSPAGMFLLDAEDRRLEQIEKDMAQKIVASAATVRATVNWDRYQVRHQGYRLKQGLGHRRPISKSQDDGTCKMPDFAWQVWMRSLPERVRCLELSQGLDREMDSRAFGIVGCITPCGIPYMTTRGGPLCGLESLALQGLPLDRLLLTQESQRELQDLAGNAMSSTVVGAAILSALIAGHKVLRKGDFSQTSKPTSRTQKSRITPQGDVALTSSNMHLDPDTVIDILKLREQATTSARYCVCEGHNSIRATCSECSGNPQHAYERWLDLPRTVPLDFVSSLRSILPGRLAVRGITPDSYKELKSNSYIPAKCWSEFLDAVFRAVGDELRFSDINRSECWTVTYDGKYSVLKLVIEPFGSITWLFFAKPRETDPALCLIREVLSKPVARMTLPVPSHQAGSTSSSILEGGTWEICAPLSSSCSLKFFGTGSKVDSYEARCGLQLPAYQNSQVWSHIIVHGADKDIKDLEVDVRGTYELLPDCGTANSCLHRRPATAGGNPTIYLFLDPTKLGEPTNDSFVFALEHRRIPGYATRMTIAEVSHTWRSSKATDKAETVIIYYRKWIPCPLISLQPYSRETGSSIQCYTLDSNASVAITNGECHNANVTLLAFTIPAGVATSDSHSPWFAREWEAINPIDCPELLRENAWLLQRAAGYSDFCEWNQIVEANIQGPCRVCVPPKPGILWGRDAKGRVKAYEDPYGAARYEREIKSRPSAFLIFRRECYQDIKAISAELRVTINVQTLLHQAYGRLPHVQTGSPAASFYWRLVPNSYDVRDCLYPKFELRSNRNDPQASQPPQFTLEGRPKLRPEQLRSLSWMIAQEKENVEPFIEEETEEALLGSLMWRAEGRVTVPKTVRGGILADDVGYGKTAIILGLLDASFANLNIDLSVSLNSTGFVPSRATLIVVPRIMVQQWRAEIAKFLGDKYNVLAFSSAAALRKTSIGDIRNSDIILVSRSVFDTAAYYQHLRRYAGASEAPDKPGRKFDDWFHLAHGFMKQHVRVLAESGPLAFLQSLRNRRAPTKYPETHQYAPSKRLRGKQYALANKDRDFEMKDDRPYAEISSNEESSGTSDGEYGNPIMLKAKIDHLLRLIPPKQFKKNEGLAGEQSSSHGEIEDDWKGFGIDGETQSWEAVLGLPFHAFHFNRLVIDEFTYAKMDRLTQLLTLQARSKWFLSGTPPLNDFEDVNTIAPFLGVHLGIDAEDDINSQHFRLKELRKQRSDAETFQAFRAPRSEAWHRRRHELAQIFLDRFARRNVAEIDEIPATEHIVLVRQSPAEKVIYLELYKQLMTYNRQLRRVNGRGGDQAERIDEIIAYSSTPEEALLKRCTSLALQGRWDDDGQPEAATCASLIRTREEQLDQTKNALNNKLKLAAWLYCSCKHEHDKFSQFMNSVIMHNFGDKSVTEEVDPLLTMAVKESKRSDWRFFYSGSDSDQKTGDEGQHGDVDEDSETIEEEDEDELVLKQKGLGGQRKTQSRFTAESKLKPRHKQKSKAKPTLTRKDENKKNKSEPLLPTKPTEPREFDSELRDVTGVLRKLVVEWVHRKRALRFLTAVRKIQTNPNPQAIPACDNCQTQPGVLSKLNILGSCGHALCSNSDCTQKTLEKEECVVEGCRGSGKNFNIINAMTLGCDTTSTPTAMSSDGDSNGDIDRSSKHGGTKLEALINIITKFPVEERALLFVQFPDLMTVASMALSSAGIKHIIITPTDQKTSSKIEKFQKEGFGDTKVLILNLGNEMAAGLNLQCANHVIFLSPFLAETQYDYDSVMIQAVGRSRRYGQTRHVHIYHLLAKMTIDVNVFQERRGNKVLVERGGRATLLDAEEAAEDETMTCQGPAMVVENAI